MTDSQDENGGEDKGEELDAIDDLKEKSCHSGVDEQLEEAKEKAEAVKEVDQKKRVKIEESPEVYGIEE